MMIRPHDLVWIDNVASLQVDEDRPDWLTHHWQATLPVVVRRDSLTDDAIPVGVRGMNRSQRLAARVAKEHIVRIVTPEELFHYCHSANQQYSAMKALLLLTTFNLDWSIGVTGSCGYQLATGINVLNEHSDLDLLIRCDMPVEFESFNQLADQLKSLPCRIDAQIETPYGGFALNEWLRDRKVMLKTNRGPVITDTPWQL